EALVERGEPRERILQEALRPIGVQHARGVPHLRIGHVHQRRPDGPVGPVGRGAELLVGQPTTRVHQPSIAHGVVGEELPDQIHVALPACVNRYGPSRSIASEGVTECPPYAVPKRTAPPYVHAAGGVRWKEWSDGKTHEGTRPGTGLRPEALRRARGSRRAGPRTDTRGPRVGGTVLGPAGRIPIRVHELGDAEAGLP